MEENEDEDAGYVEISALKKHFDTAAWESIMVEDSKISKILRHPALKNEKCTKDHHVCPEYLIAFALLNCPGKPGEKAEELYNVLQEGGLAKHTFITASDKDIPPLFEKFCTLSTTDLFDMMEKISGISSDYDESELEQLRNAHEQVREDVFLDDVFGHQSRLNNAEFLKFVCAKASYMFSAHLLRKKVFEQAKVTVKTHITGQ
jgi:hypothetical protein